MLCVYQSKNKKTDNSPKAVVLLSGGMDSTICAALAKSIGYQVLGLSIFYGQRHEIELEAAEKIAKALDISLFRIQLPPDTITGSPLTDLEKELPTNRNLEEMNDIAPSYVPARNTIFLALAASFAEAKGAQTIYYGAHKEDYCGYPDCRPEYFKAMSLAVMLGTAQKIELEAPFLQSSKAEMVHTAVKLKVPLQLTHSCYQGKKIACGVCDTCLIRIKAFQKAGYIDPIPYKIKVDWKGCKKYNEK